MHGEIYAGTAHAERIKTQIALNAAQLAPLLISSKCLLPQSTQVLQMLCNNTFHLKYTLTAAHIGQPSHTPKHTQQGGKYTAYERHHTLYEGQNRLDSKASKPQNPRRTQSACKCRQGKHVGHVTQHRRESRNSYDKISLAMLRTSLADNVDIQHEESSPPQLN